MDVIENKNPHIDVAFEELFLSASEFLMLQLDNLKRIVELEQAGDAIKAYDALLKFGETRFPELSNLPNTDCSRLRTPLIKSASFEALEGRVKSSFTKYVLVEFRILKRKSIHLGVILEQSKRGQIQVAYDCLKNYCKDYQNK